MAVADEAQVAPPAAEGQGDRYKWIALSNTTLGILMVMINQSILLISLPALFRGIKLNPLPPGNMRRRLPEAAAERTPERRPVP